MAQFARRVYYHVSLIGQIHLSQDKKQERGRGEFNVKLRLNCGLVFAVCLGTSFAWADSLELKNGSLIKGKFMGGTAREISFQVGSSVQKYNVADIVSLKFDSDGAASDQPNLSTSSLPNEPQPTEQAGVKTPAYVTIPAGTRISVRTIDAL